MGSDVYLENNLDTLRALLRERDTQIEQLQQRLAASQGSTLADPGQLGELRVALQTSVTALDDLLNVYAPEFCDDARVAEARTRIGVQGTLAYIADVQQTNRAALGPYETNAAALASKCWCYTCAQKRTDPVSGFPEAMMRMILCPTCGNKRCPRATHHDLVCTGSNEPGQPGSRY